jgi:glucose-6-phosphate isomerase
LESEPTRPLTARQIAILIHAEDNTETVFKVLEHLAANPSRRIRKIVGKTPFDSSYQFV